MDAVKKENILVDYMKKICATTMGDSYKEYVLGKDNKGSFQIDVYTRDFNSKEIRESFTVPEECYKEILSYIKENNMENLKKKTAIPLCGGDYILRFYSSSGEFIRLTTANTAPGLLSKAGDILMKYTKRVR